MINLEIMPIHDDDLEPMFDHGHCLDCGCGYPLADMESETETESIDGHLVASYEVYRCNNCGEWDVECEFSASQAEKWNEWTTKKETTND